LGVGLTTPHRKKISLLRKSTRSLGPGWIPVNVAQFRYLGTTITNQTLIQDEIKRRFYSGNTCYHSVQNILSSPLPSDHLKIRIYKTIILPVVLYGRETWSLILREEHRLRLFENSVLRRIFGPKRDEVTGG
jgi:hypothetical protein